MIKRKLNKKRGDEQRIKKNDMKSWLAEIEWRSFMEKVKIVWQLDKEIVRVFLTAMRTNLLA